MHGLTFRYLVDYYDLLAVTGTEFDAWLNYELNHGGVNELRVTHKVDESIERYVPSSQRPVDPPPEAQGARAPRPQGARGAH